MNARKALPFVLYALLVALPGGCGGDDDDSSANGGASANKGGAGGKNTGGTSSGGKTGSGGQTITDGGVTARGGSSTGTAGMGEGGDIGAAGMSGGVGPTTGGTANGGSANGSGGAAHGGATTSSGGSGHGGSFTTTGGAGGEGAVGGSSGGGGESGGDTGGAGGGSSQTLLQCAESCTIDSDCAKGGSLNGRICSPTSHRCIMHLCEVDNDCIPDASAWAIGDVCTGDGTCASGEVCVDVKGVGHCVAVPQNDSCGSGKAPVSWAHFGGGDDVLVCGDLSNKCFAGTCKVPCQPSDCTLPAACNPATGACDACASDAYCTTGSKKPPHCNVATGVCECHDSSECTGVRNANVCVNGRCGCSDTSACTRKVGDNAVLICE